MKIAFLFPGQGSQTVGMGKELREKHPAVKAVFDRAAERLGAEYVDVILNGPEEKLRQTKFTQPALFIMSAAVTALLKEKGIVPQWTAGHSLGEYSALHAAGAFDLDTGLQLVKARGDAIQEASEKIPGTMAALIGLERAQVVDLCKTASAKGVCEPVNYNCPGQIVIAGAVDAVKEAIALAQQAGATKSILLNVSGPFHSSLMKPAADRMKPVLEAAAIVDAAVPVYTNVDGQPTRSASEIRRKLALQIDHAVLWEDGIRQLAGQSPDLFLEAGPGRVLSGLLRRIDKTKKASNVEDQKSLESLLQQCGLPAQ